MFEVSFYESADSEELSFPGKHYDDSFPTIFHEKMDQVDAFFFLADLVNIVNDCTQDFLGLPGGEETNFWQVNKAFIAYLNAVYFYREYAKNYSEPVKSVIAEYLDKRKLFWMIGEFRNHVIHKSIIIMHRSLNAGDIYISREEICSRVEDNISSLCNSGKNKGRKASEKQFLSELRKLSSPVVRTMEDKDYISVKVLVQAAKKELADLIQEVLTQTYHNDLIPVLKWLLSLIYKDNGHYKDTKISRKMPYTSVRDGDDFFLPASQLETILYELVHCLGRNNALCQHTYQWLLDEGYAFDIGTEYDIPRLFSE